MTPTFVIACYPWASEQENQLSLEAGKVYQIVSETEHGWARGHDLQGNEGFFPSSFVKPCTTEEVKYIMDSAEVVPPSQALSPREDATPAAPTTQTAEPEEVSLSERASSQHDSEETPLELDAHPKRKRRSSRKMSRSTLHEVGRESSTTDTTRKKKKKRTEKAKASTHRKRTRPVRSESSHRRNNSVHRLHEFEKRTWRKEVDWSMMRVNEWKDVSSLLSGSTQVARLLTVQQEYRVQVESALASANKQALAPLVEQHRVDVESCDWEIFERHQAFKGQWDARRDLLHGQLEMLSEYLNRLLRLQQEQLFNVACDDVGSLVAEIEEKKLVSHPPSSQELDPWIAALRARVDAERSMLHRVDSLCAFYESVTETRSASVFYLVLCDGITHIFASANMVNESADSASAVPAVPSPMGLLEDLLQPLLVATVTVHNLQVSFAALLCKVMASWGASQSDVDHLVANGSSLTELFAQVLSYECTAAYLSQVKLLSEKGAANFAQAILVRMLALACAEQLDMTRSVIDQLVVKLPNTVIPSHSRPENEQSAIPFQGTPYTILFPAVLETAAAQEAMESRIDQLLKDSAARAGSADVPAHGYIDAQILTGTGWEVRQRAPPLLYKLRHPKIFLHAPLGYRTATVSMLEFLEELGWRGHLEPLASTETPEDSPAVPSDPPVKEEDETLQLLERAKEHQALIDKNTNALDQLSRLILAVQQGLVGEQQARLSLDAQIQQLSQSIAQCMLPSASSPDPNDVGWKPLPPVPPKAS